jgi:Ca-activated chloride channel family protein
MISLGQPAYLLIGGLLLLPYLVCRRRAWFYSCVQLFQGTRRVSLPVVITSGLTGLGILLLLVALGKPQKGTEYLSETVATRDILLTLDLSLSMEGFLEWESGKVPPTKLELIQDAALQFVKTHQSDRLGLIVFGDDAFGVWPLSLDNAMMQKRLEKLASLLPPALRGTHVAKALDKSLDHFAHFDHDATRILLLLTDGLDSIEPKVEEQLIRRLKQSKVSLYVLGMQLNDSTSIVKLARQVEGGYFNINNADELAKALRDIDRLERSPVTVNRRVDNEDLFAYFASSGLVLLLLSTMATSAWVWEV